jgi:phosphotransferase system  glucose/maltose/N-acetylglucosamine-specific IIC component
MDRTRLILIVGIAMLVVGLFLAVILPYVALDDPENVAQVWVGTICGGFLLAMLGAIVIVTGVFRVFSARRTEGQPPMVPTMGQGCPHQEASGQGGAPPCHSCPSTCDDPPGGPR